jgi:hypothetical protein
MNSLNPLEFGAVCWTLACLGIVNCRRLNPLEFGAVCWTQTLGGAMTDFSVLIPLSSGLSVGLYRFSHLLRDRS